MDKEAEREVSMESSLEGAWTDDETVLAPAVEASAEEVLTEVPEVLIKEELSVEETPTTALAAAKVLEGAEASSTEELQAAEEP